MCGALNKKNFLKKNAILYVMKVLKIVIARHIVTIIVNNLQTIQ